MLDSDGVLLPPSFISTPTQDNPTTFATTPDVPCGNPLNPTPYFAISMGGREEDTERQHGCSGMAGKLLRWEEEGVGVGKGRLWRGENAKV